MEKTRGTIGKFIGIIGLVAIVGFILFRIFFNIVENFRLITGGSVTQGIISRTGNCGGGRHTPTTPWYVQFADTQGRQQNVAANDCFSIGNPFRQNEGHVSIVYVLDTPSIARIQDDLVLQSVLEVLFLLIVPLIVRTTIQVIAEELREP